ncbi:hypothetical protein [Deinococcus sp.]|uniref:hypothetical protein n=1 Tax=Deinococcus sp. TaxID=47478 RepID=UPI00286EB013|nr:hypothetical protein [Deinococcus sp.]
MSYTFGIWQHTDGDSLLLDDIQSLFDGAWSDEQPLSPTIESLIEAVQSKFPDDEHSTCVWDSMPLTEQGRGTTFYPGVRLNFGDETLEAVFDCLYIESGIRGLYLIDWQTEKIYSPDEFQPEENP